MSNAPPPTPPARGDEARAWLAHFWGSIDTTALLLAFEAGYEKGAARERGEVITILTDYMRGCEETGCKLADKEDETSVNMYWRADGASDALEHLIGVVRARSGTKGEEG